MVEHHGLPEGLDRPGGGGPSIHRRLVQEPGLVEEFVAFEHALLVQAMPSMPKASRSRAARGGRRRYEVSPSSRLAQSRSAGRMALSMMGGLPSRQSSHGRCDTSSASALRRLRVVLVADARQREIAHREPNGEGISAAWRPRSPNV